MKTHWKKQTRLLNYSFPNAKWINRKAFSELEKEYCSEISAVGIAKIVAIISFSKILGRFLLTFKNFFKFN